MIVRVVVVIIFYSLNDNNYRGHLLGKINLHG